MTAGGFGTGGEAPFEIRGFLLSDAIIAAGLLVTISSFAEFAFGGAGGVGTIAIQVAKAIGARVLTTARAADHAFVRSLGADEAIEPGDGESKVASILFTDIEGFSTISETMSPQELASTINAYFQAVGEVIARHGGVILLFEGDAMLITFNAVSPSESWAQAPGM